MEDEATMYIQRQHWEGSCDRLLIADQYGKGTVQVDILLTEEAKERFKADALLWALWVDKDSRRKGEGTALIAAAEREAKASGCKTIALEWYKREAPRWVYSWYERLGYEEKAFGRESSLMVKQLD